MATNLQPPESLATGVGALPHTDPVQACDDVIGIFARFPYVPTLPNRSLKESIVFCDSPRVPGAEIRDNKLLVGKERDLMPEMEQVYLDYLELNYREYGIDSEYGSGFAEMQRRDLSGARTLKCQITGPVTFGMQVTDTNRRPIYYDEQFADLLPKISALRALWCEKEMLKIPGISETLVVLNEPYLAALGSSVIPIQIESVRAGWEDISSVLDGGLGIHCCSNTDWKFIFSLKPAFLSFDAFSCAKEFLLYMDSLADFMESGGVVAWGIVPADYTVFSVQSEDGLFEQYQEIRRRVTEHVDPVIFDAQSMITPTCGIRFSDEQGSREIMRCAYRISGRIRGE